MSGVLDSPVTPTINFTQIPPAGSLLVPGVYVEIGADYSNIGLLPFPARILAIGQAHLSGAGAGNATAGTIYSITLATQPVALFGAGSPLAEQLAYILASNPGIPIDAVGLVPAGGAVAAAGSITFAGSPTVNATQAIGVAGFRVPVNFTVGMSPAAMATATVAAAAAIYNAQNLPVTLATNSTAGQVALTSIYNGLLSNQLDLRLNPAQGDVTVPGVTATVVAIGTGTAGTGTPDITPVMTAIATTWYTGISCGFDDVTSLGILTAALASRYGAMTNVDSHAYVGKLGSQGTLDSFVTPIDCPFLSVMGAQNPQDPAWRWSGALCGVAETSLMRDPSQQLRGLALPNIIAPAPLDRFYEVPQQALLSSGVATWQVAPGGIVLIQRAVTTYTVSPLGVPDSAWQDIMVPKTMTRVRYDWKYYLLLNFPNYKLAPDGSTAAVYNDNVVTPRRVLGLWAARCTLYARAGWIENEAVTIAASIATIDANDKNRLNCQFKLQIIGNNMVDAVQLLFAA